MWVYLEHFTCMQSKFYQKYQNQHTTDLLRVYILIKKKNTWKMILCDLHTDQVDADNVLDSSV